MKTSNTIYASLSRLAGFKNRGHLNDYEVDWLDQNESDLTRKKTTFSLNSFRKRDLDLNYS